MIEPEKIILVEAKAYVVQSRTGQQKSSDDLQRGNPGSASETRSLTSPRM